MSVIVLDCFQIHLNPFNTFTPLISNKRHNAILESTVRYIRWPFVFLTSTLSWDVMLRRLVEGYWLSSWLLAWLTLRTWGRRQLIYPKNRWTTTDYAVLHPGRKYSSWSRLWEPQIQHFPKVYLLKCIRTASLLCVPTMFRTRPAWLNPPDDIRQRTYVVDLLIM